MKIKNLEEVMNKNFKIREQDYKAMQGMNEKQYTAIHVGGYS